MYEEKKNITVNKMNNYLPIIILAILSFGLLLFILLRKKVCDKKDCKKALTSIPGLPSKFQAVDNHKKVDSVLDLASLVQPTNIKSTGNNWEISKDPMYLPNGLYIHMDEPLANVVTDEIEREHKEEDKEDDNTETVLTYDGVFNTIKDLNITTDKTNINKFRKNLTKDLKSLIYSINHYIELIVNFLASNPSAPANWKTLLTTLGNIKQVLNKIEELKTTDNTDDVLPPLRDKLMEAIDTLNKLKIPSIDVIYDSLKFTITKLGGFSKLLHRFQRRIKWDMIQAIVNDDKYRPLSNNQVDLQGSKQCTAYPLKWWQNCPDDQKPVGSRGWGKDKSVYACNKWYQHLSGELMCAKYKSNFQYPVGGNCNKILDVYNFAKDNKDWHKKNPFVAKVVSRSLSSILASLSLIPSLHAVVRTIKTIFSLAMPFLEGNYTWLINDLADVCYNYQCEGVTPDGKVCGGEKLYCVPNITDVALANRDCQSNPKACFREPSGCCTKETTATLCSEKSDTSFSASASASASASDSRIGGLLDYSILIS